MKREDIEKLLGGYATGTLTPEEREALFAAALEDQVLFDALAHEEPLRQLLQDPLAKTRLRSALVPAAEPRYRRWLRPAVWAVPAVGLAAIVVILVMQRPAERQPVTIAQVLQPHRTEPVIPVPSPLPRNLEKRQLPRVTAQVVEVRPAAAPAPAVPPPPPEDQLKIAGLPANDAALAQIAPPRAPVGAARRAESVRVEAAVSQLEAAPERRRVLDARALFYGLPPPPIMQTNLVEPQGQPRAAPRARAPVFASAPASTTRLSLGLRYSIVQRLANGQTATVDPSEPVPAGAEVQLRFEPNDDGYLSVFENTPGGWRLFTSSRLDRQEPYLVPQTGSLAFPDSGPKQLFVVFSREPLPTPYPVPEERLDQLLSGNTAEGATYVVSTAAIPSTQLVAFPITLQHN